MKHVRVSLVLAALLAATACSGDSTGPTAPSSVRAPSPDLVESGEVAPTGPTVETDLMDYAPGAIVTITGAGFAAGETVAMTLTEDANIHAPRSWNVIADEEGAFVDTSFSPEAHHLGVLFTLSATGLSSETSASWFFTDGTISAASVVAQEATCTTNTSIFVGTPKGLCARASITNSGGSTAFNFIWYRSGSPGAAFAKVQRNAGVATDGSGSVTNTFNAGTTGLWEARLCLDNPASGPCLNPLTGTPIAQYYLYGGKFAFLTAPQNLNAGQCSAIITVQKQTAAGVPTTEQSGVSISTTSAGGAFYTNSSCTTLLTSNPSGGTPTTGMNAVILSGGSTFSFYYKDATGGSPTLTANKLNTYEYAPATQVQSVVAEAPTTTALTALPASPSQFGTSVTFTATVTKQSDASAVSSGSVSFYDGGTCVSPGSTLASGVALNGSGTAQASTSSLSVGGHTIIACYSGVANDLSASNTSVSYTITQVVTTTVVTVTPSTQQYSDLVDLSASITPTSVNLSTLAGSVQFSRSSNGIAYTDIGSPVAVVAGVATLSSVPITDAAGSYTIKAIFTSTNTDFAGSDGTTPLTVTREDAAITYSSANPAALQVSTPGGTLASNALTLTIQVKEKIPDLAALTAAAGDISLAGLSVSLTPIAGGSSTSLSCTSGTAGAGYNGVKTFTCTNASALAVNVYEVAVTVTGNYYTALTYNDAFTVFDPSLGFATGGGKFVIDGDMVNFGFNMKYKKGGASPQGNLIVVRHHADGTTSRLKSNAVTGLAIQDVGGCGIATFTGKSTYTTWDAGSGQYVTSGGVAFTFYAEDCNNPGSGVDSVWLDGMGMLDMTGPAGTNKVPLTGGNVAVPHKAAK